MQSSGKAAAAATRQTYPKPMAPIMLRVRGTAKLILDVILITTPFPITFEATTSLLTFCGYESTVATPTKGREKRRLRNQGEST